MYDKDLIEFCQKVKPIKVSVSKEIKELAFKKRILESTSFLPLDCKITTRYYCILNNLLEVPKCPNCDNNTVPNKLDFQLGFSKFCSLACSRSYSKRIPKESLEKLSNKEWLYNQRIILEKSWELIAQELNVSEQPVKTWAKKLEIPHVRYNESNTKALIYLRSKEWLYNRHKVDKKKCDEIAEELGISKATVSVWLSKHNIEGNNGNIYPRKFTKNSKPQQEIVDFLKEEGLVNIETNVRGMIGTLELDIYLPDKNFAIEYNGFPTHLFKPEKEGFAARKDRLYHVQKTNDCEKIGIELVHVFPNGWNSKKEIWKSLLRSKLGLIKTRIYARQCEVKEVSVQDKNRFLNENHLQGKDKSKWKYGLYHNQELVSLITFGKPRYNKKCDYELIRFCSKNNVSVTGGFSKLVEHFRREHKGSIVSYADRTYSQGKLYETNGFILEKINQPNYWYVLKNTDIPIHRSNFKNEVNKTEWEVAQEKGYSKFYDCGTKTYILD